MQEVAGEKERQARQNKNKILYESTGPLDQRYYVGRILYESTGPLDQRYYVGRILYESTGPLDQ